jgi:hypothetical protein
MPTISAISAALVMPWASSIAISFAVGVPVVFLAMSTGFDLQLSQSFGISYLVVWELFRRGPCRAIPADFFMADPRMGPAASAT